MESTTLIRVSRTVALCAALAAGILPGWAADVPFRSLSTLIEQAESLGLLEPIGPLGTEGSVYEFARPAVFRVEAGGGEGTGFLVDRAGLVLTNLHVVRESRYVGIQVDPQRKYPGTLLAADENRDLAVIRVHPDAVAGLRPLPLASESPAVGTRIVAIGNPLGQEWVLTTGIVSKVEDEALISDLTINPGNSGGPILDLQGRVVAVATFGVQGRSGPGVAGAIRVEAAHAVVAEAKQGLAVEPAPGASLLPVIQTTPFPLETLRASVSENRDLALHYLAAGKFQLQVHTPVSAFHEEHSAEIKAARRQEKRRQKQLRRNRGKSTDSGEGLYDPARHIYDWQSYAGAYDPVVTIIALPEVKMTGGSKAGRIFGAMFGVMTPGKYRFKRDFREMKLLRDGEEVQPIFPGRICETVSVGGYNSIHDVGCYGAYVFRPEVFEHGHTYQVQVLSEEAPNEPITVALDGALLARIRHDFEAYPASDATVVADTASR